MHRSTCAIVLALLPAIGGCLPASYTQVPEITGRVVAPDGTPCPNADVRIVSVSPEPHEWIVQADSRGMFRQHEIREWGIAWLVPTDMFPPKFKLSATHEGRSASPLHFTGGDLYHPHYLGLGNAAPTIDVGDVRVD